MWPQQFFEPVFIEKLSVSGAFQNIEVSLIALLFNLLLIMIVESQRIRGKQTANALTFVLIAIMSANAITCLYVFLAYADIGTSDIVICVLQSAALMSNTAVCYLFSKHVLHFVNRTLREDKKMPSVNRLLVVAEGILLTVWLAFAIPYIIQNGVLIRPVGLFYYLIGFVMETFHLLYAMWMIVSRRGVLDRRSYMTVALTFLLTIATVFLQALIGRAPVINYLGATFGMFLFYFNAETPDYLALTRTLEELEIAKERSDDASRAKSAFLVNMSHEIRTPLTALLAMNQMILREGTEEHVKAYAKSAERAGQNLLSVINDILDFSKIESGRMEIVSEPYLLSEALADVCGILSFRASEKDLLFKTEIDPHTPDALIGDGVRMRQMMTNLLNNAVKYTREGEVVLQVRADAFREENGKRIADLFICVSDTGIGIAEGDLPRLFDQFERFDMRKNNTIEGTGLGLAIVKELCELMDGSVSVKSAYGEGSAFTLTIPQRVNGETEIGVFDALRLPGEEKDAPYHASFYAPKAHLLMVDDTEINLTVFQKLLDKTGVHVDAVSGGLEAIALTQDVSYDVIFLDQRMPGMDGEETLSYIRNQENGVNQKTPIVCLTADAVQGAKERYLEKGFTDYLSKPIDWRMLEAMVARYLPPEKILSPTDVRAETPSQTNAAENTGDNNALDEMTLRRFYDATEGLSFRNAIQNCMDAETLCEVLSEYVKSSSTNMKQIRTFSETGDIAAFGVKAHSIKGTSRVIGALDLAETAYRLEQLADNKETDMIREETPAFLSMYEALVEQLSGLIEE